MTKPKFTALECSACLLLCIAAPANAANWTSSASVTPAVTYTDNVCLSSDDEKSEWIGLVTPAGSINADGSRANLNLRGAVEVNTLTDSKLENLGCNGGRFGDRDQYAPSLNGAAYAELVKDWFFIDGTVNVYQNQITPFVGGGGDSLNRTGNTNTTYDYTVSPYISRRFKNVAELNLRYTWDDQYNSEDIVGDNTQQRARAYLGSVPGVSNWIWAVEGNYSKLDYSDTRVFEGDQDDSELKSAQVNLGYQFNRTWQVNGFYGNEWNDFVSSRDDIDGTYWDAGLRWTPNARTTVEAGTGDRFFGSSPRFSISHSHKHSTFSANYAKALTYDRDIRALDDSIPGFDPGLSTLSTSPILDERFSLAYSYQGRRSQIGLNAYQSEQTREENRAESTFRGVSLASSRSLSRQLSLNARVQWSEEDPKNADDRLLDSSETWIGTLGIQYQLSQSLNLGFRYQYTDRQSDSAFSNTAFDEYTENRITLDLRIDL